MGRELIAGGKPEKKWSELTEAEQDAFATAIFEKMKSNYEDRTGAEQQGK